MESTPARRFFQCLCCQASNFDASATRWRCLACGEVYPVEGGLPLLVRSWQAHKAELAWAQATKPTWYCEEQPPELASPWRHHLRRRRLYVEAAIAQYLRDAGLRRAFTLLDLGCGDGNHLQYLGKYAEVFLGSDYNLVRLARARQQNPGAILFLADIVDYPARDEVFDIIFCNHVIEHIADDRGALRTIHRILKPHGLLVLGTPNEGAWWWQLAYRLQPQALVTTDHLHFYTAESLGQMLRGLGFTLRELRHTGWGPPHWGIDRRLRRHKVLDDVFEAVGKRLVPSQASSLYVLATKA